MKSTLPALLALLLASCDQQKTPEESSKNSEKSSARSTKSERELSLKSKGQLRERLDAALATADEAEKESLLAALVRETMDKSPEFATEALAHMPLESSVRIELLRELAAAAVQKSPEEAITWAESLDSPATVQQAKEQIAIALGGTDPGQATKLALGDLDPSQPLNETSMEILQNWVGTSPTEAAAWVQKLPNGEARNTGIRSVATRWLHSDAKGAIEWNQGIRDESTKNESTKAIVEALAGTPDPIRESYLEKVDSKAREWIETQVKQHIDTANAQEPVEEE